MEPKNVTTSLATNKSAEVIPLFDMLNKPEIVKRFELACGAQAGSVMTNIINAANSNPDILKCEPMTVITAGLNAAAMKLSLAKSLGQACILPFSKSKKVNNQWVTSSTAELVVMVRGIKDMAMRTNKYRILNSFTVYEGQQWEENQMTGLGSINGKRVSDKPIGYGAYLKLFTGYEATEYMTVEEILAHGARYSKSWDAQNNCFNPKSKWGTDFDMMAEKTVLKRLIMNKGVINDSDRAILDAVEDNTHGDVINYEIYDGSVGEDGEENRVSAESPEPEIDPAQDEEYINAKEVLSPSGKKIFEFDDKTLQALMVSKQSGVTDEMRNAAKIINDRRILNAKKATHTVTIEEIYGA